MARTGIAHEYAEGGLQSHLATGQTDPSIYAGIERFSGGVTIDARYHQWVINLTLSGRCSWYHQDGEVEVTAGSLLLIQPYSWMAWKVPLEVSEWRTVYAVCNPSLRSEGWLAAHTFDNGMAHIRLEDEGLFNRIRSGMLAVHRIYTKGMANRDDWTMIALDRMLLTLRTHYAPSGKLFDARIQQAVEFVHKHYAETIIVADIARAVYLSPSHLSLLFSRQTGMAPMQYLEQVRLRRAAEMLRFTSASVAEIAVAIGYRDADYFGTRFRHCCGLSPRAYRRAQSLRPS